MEPSVTGNSSTERMGAAGTSLEAEDAGSSGWEEEAGSLEEALPPPHAVSTAADEREPPDPAGKKAAGNLRLSHEKYLP